MCAFPSFEVLFPAEQAVPAAEFAPRLGDGRLLIVVLDGSWNDAKRMNRVIPAAVPRVPLEAAAKQKPR